MNTPADDFDPDDVLKGWQPQARGAPAPADMTHVLDGWVAPGVPGAPGVPAARPRRPDDDVTDLLHIDLPPIERPHTELPHIELPHAGLRPAADDVDYTEAPVVVRHHVNPRLLAQWQPGVWVGAVKRVCDATTEFLHTPRGPVVETTPPQWLLALWSPQSLSAPLLSRWPLRVMLRAAEAGRASDELLPLMPPAALLWLTQEDIDWSLVAELVLHHDTALRPFQLQALRSFADAQREATFLRLNKGYRQAAAGQPVAQWQDG